MTKIAQRQWLVTVSSPSGAPVVTGNFLTKTGGNVTSDSTKVYDGGSDQYDILTGLAEIENVTIGRPYDLDRDASIVAALRKVVGKSHEYTVSCQPVNRDYIATGKATVYTGCQLVSITEPEFDGSSSDAASFEMEFAVKSVAST